MPLAQKALALFETAGNKCGVAIALNQLSAIYRMLGDYRQAFDCAQKSFRLYEQTNNRRRMAEALSGLADIYEDQNNFQQALSYQERSLAIFQELGDIIKHGAANTLIDMSGLFLAQGKYAEALPLAGRAVSLSRQMGSRLNLWLALTALGYGQLGLNRLSEARQSFAEAVSIIEKLRAQTAGGDEERRRYFEGGVRAHHGFLSLLVSASARSNRDWKKPTSITKPFRIRSTPRTTN